MWYLIILLKVSTAYLAYPEGTSLLCRSATLPPETTISKWRVAATIRQLLQLLTGGTSAFGGLRAIASPRPPSNFRDAPVFRSHQLSLYGHERLSGRSLLSSHSQGSAAQVMFLTNPQACPETVQQTSQKHFRGEINNQPLGVT